MSPLPHRQRGSVAIVSVIFVMVAVILGLAIDTGYVFYVKRNLQKVADLAALAGAQSLPDCTQITASVQTNLKANLSAADYLTVSQDKIQCGTWTAGARTLSSFTAGSTNANAVLVQLSKSVPSLFAGIGTRVVQVDAVARSAAPVAAFTVGSGLLRMDSTGLLPQLLANIGVDPTSIDLVSYAGLANANITPAGLLQQLGIPVTANIDVATLNSLATIQHLTIGQLLDASKSYVVSQYGTANLAVSALSTLQAELGVAALNLPIQLLGNGTTPGIFANITSANGSPDVASALNAQVNVLDLVNTMLGVATGSGAVSIPTTNLNVLGSSVSGNVSVIQPPAIGIGGVGTTASDAQVRVRLDISTSGVPLLGSLINVNLPLIIEVAQSTGTLSHMCEAGLPANEAEIDVSSGVANLCVGSFKNGVLDSQSSCATMTGPATIATVLGFPISTEVNLSLLGQSTTNPPFAVGTTQTTNTNVNLGTTASSVTNALLLALMQGIGATNPVATTSQQNQLATNLVTALNGDPLTLSKINQSLGTAENQVTGVANSLGSTLTNVLTLNIGGTVSSVDSLVSNVLGTADALLSGLGNLLGDVTCDALLIPSAQQACRVTFVQPVVGANSGQNALTALSGLVLQVLQPTLNALSTSLIQNLLFNDILGIKIGVTDVSLLSVDCGTNHVQLVY